MQACKIVSPTSTKPKRSLKAQLQDSQKRTVSLPIKDDGDFDSDGFKHEVNTAIQLKQLKPRAKHVSFINPDLVDVLTKSDSKSSITLNENTIATKISKTTSHKMQRRTMPLDIGME